MIIMVISVTFSLPFQIFAYVFGLIHQSKSLASYVNVTFSNRDKVHDQRMDLRWKICYVWRATFIKKNRKVWGIIKAHGHLYKGGHAMPWSEGEKKLKKSLPTPFSIRLKSPRSARTRKDKACIIYHIWMTIHVLPFRIDSIHNDTIQIPQRTNSVHERPNPRVGKRVQQEQLPDTTTALRDRREPQPQRTASQSLVPEPENEVETGEGTPG